MGTAAATLATAAAPTIVQAASSAAGTLPQVEFGPYRISRLLVGGNPVSGHSHFSAALSQEMMDYFTAVNVKKMLAACEREGINTWQSRGDAHIRRLLREYRGEGGTIQWIAQTASEFASFERNVRECAASGAIGIYHHGSRTDQFWQNGQLDRLRDDLKIMRDTGLRIGVASHIPEVLETIDEKGWDVDFYMACFYNVNKRIDGEEAFLAEDREAMCRFIGTTPKQCIAFKILAAGRHTGSPGDLHEAFRFAFDHIKEQDVVGVGMYPRHGDQVAENARIVRTLHGA
jgi:hypothetical protein